MRNSKNRINTTLISACIMGLLSACSSNIADEIPKPAILAGSSVSNTKVLSEAMSLALNGTKVSLVSNAFLKDSQHTLEKRSFTDTNAADGLILGIPKVDRFTLFTTGSTCHLVYEKTGQKYPLNGVNCIAL